MIPYKHGRNASKEVVSDAELRSRGPCRNKGVDVKGKKAMVRLVAFVLSVISLAHFLMNSFSYF